LFNDALLQDYKNQWVVHCEPSLAGADHLVKYLGQYTHRIAITNQRIINIEGGQVTFIAKDYRDNAAKKPVTIMEQSSCAALPCIYYPEHLLKSAGMEFTTTPPGRTPLCSLCLKKSQILRR